MARGKKANKIISKYADLPDIEKNPRGWVEATDAITKQRFDPVKPLPYDHDRGRDAQSFMYYDEALRELAEARRMWCSRHLAFSRTLVWYLTEKDLEESWLGKTKEEQEQLIFKSFQKLEAQNTWPIDLGGPDKINCPELCLDALLGEGFLDVVKKFLLDNNDEPPKQPFIVVNERFDRIIGWKPGDSAQMRKATLEGRRLHRTLYIHSIVEVVVALLYDHDPKFITVATEHAKTKETLEQNRDWITAMGIDFDRFSKKEGARRKAQALYCSYCLKPEDKLADGRKMSVCTKCNEFGRQVRYCSRECQKLAWPQHKKECGRAIEVEDVFEEYTPRAKDRATKTRPDIFPPEVGYRRSADLLRLITHLNQEPRKDYVMVLPPERGSTIPDFLGITLDELPASTTFAIMRNRAMCRGDPGAIFYVYRVLQRYSSQEGHESILRAQLKKEYGTTFQGILDQLQKGQMPPGPEKVTKEEVNKMLAILRDMGRFEEEIADFEPTSDGKTQLLGLQVGLTRDLTVVVEWPEKTMPPVITLEVAYMPDGAKATLSRTERRNRQRAAVKGLLTSSASGEASAGPNANIPGPDDGFDRTPFLEKQISYLRVNPQADYILWGMDGDPSTAYAVRFEDITTAMAFQAYRERAFRKPGYDIDALVYIIMALENAVRRRKIGMNAIMRQMSAEYEEGYGEIARASIKGKHYHRRDGKVFTLGQIPINVDTDWSAFLIQLKEAGRFSDMLSNIPAEKLKGFKPKLSSVS